MLNPLPLSQFDERWRHKLIHPQAIPNVPRITINNFGCLISCVASMLGLTPNILVDQNQEMFSRDGNMSTVPLLKKLGYNITNHPLIEGQPIPAFDEPVIARTSFYADRNRSGLPYAFRTHFFIILKGGTEMIDPAARPGQNGPKPIGKYLPFINEYRKLTRIGGVTQTKCPTCGK